MTGIITNIQRFCTHDGPGVRTTVFLKGCPLRCVWCHNPETNAIRPQPQINVVRCIACGACEAVCPAHCHHMRGTRFDASACRRCLKCAEVCPTGAVEICGREWTAQAIVREAEKDRAFYGDTGGITLSGGEPMNQPAFVLDILTRSKDVGLTTCVETCGYFPQTCLEPLVSYVDTFLWDIKDTDETRHRQNTGVGLERIYANLRYVAAAGKRIILRCVIVKGINDHIGHMERVLALKEQIGAERIDLLPFHPYGSSKKRALGDLSPAMDRSNIPDPETMDALKRTVDVQNKEDRLS